MLIHFFVRCQRNSENFGICNVQEVFTVRYELNLCLQSTFVTFTIHALNTVSRLRGLVVEFPPRRLRYDSTAIQLKQVSAPYLGIPLSVTFHKCFICIFILNTILKARTNGGVREPSNKQCSIASRGALDR